MKEKKYNMSSRNSFPRGRVAFFVSNNVHKFHEMRSVLGECKIATALLRVKSPEIQDDDIKNIAKISAMRGAKKCNLPIIVEDAGLFIEALSGFPGPYSSYVYHALGIRGILKLMEDVDKRNAYFRSVVAFCDLEEDLLKCFHGKIEGSITREERGSSGFGFDPLFMPLNCRGKTFAEMSMKEKNNNSHRAEAFQKFARWYVSTFPQRF